MRRFSILVVLLTAFATTSAGQTSATGVPYFQQHVHYTLDATLLDDAVNPRLKGSGHLDYTNNSPDTLREVYFHLYWNLFKHGSYGEKAPNRDHSEEGSYGHGGIDVNGWDATDPDVPESDTGLHSGPQVTVDNTIARVQLRSPLLPGHRLRIRFEWTGLLPNYGIRSTWGWHDGGARNFATAQWYPQVCVYDNHGWHPDQYVGMGEFFTDYGQFDVTLHMPDRFSTVVSTGWQTNQEMLPDSIRVRLAFAKSHPDSVVRVADRSAFTFTPIGPNEALRTWTFHADSVRDFAWCADEAYIWDAIYGDDIMHHALYWENSRDFWSKEAARITRFTISTNSKFAGQYLYPNAFLCESYEGGMEYPGIVFIGPYSSGSEQYWPQNVMMHELGHEWYPMMMGSNEIDYGYMDEGFNTFITTLVHEQYFGRYNNANNGKYGLNDDERTSNLRQAMMQQLAGDQEPSKTKADMFHSYRTYANATYPHTGSVFFMLRYTMGEKAFGDFMHLYYNRWRFKHPYPDDLVNAAEDIERTEGDTDRVRSRGDLRWFFDEWFNKTWKLDYAIGDFDVSGNTATVRVDRKERAVMPVDLVFTLEDGSTVQKWIPVDDWLRTVADERIYSYTFSSRPVHVALNPGNELLDINRLNNTSGWLPPTQVNLVPRLFGDVKPIDKYAVRSSPFIAPTSGKLSDVILGWTVLGSYLDRSDRLALGIRFADLYHPSGIGGVLQYHNVLDWLSPWTDLDISVVNAGASHDEQLYGGRKEFYGLKLSQVVNRPGTNDPVHIFNVGYDLSGAVISRVDTADGTNIPINRVMGGYTFHSNNSVDDFALAGQVEAGLGDPRATYSKLAISVNNDLTVTRSWDLYTRVFAGSMQPIGRGLPSRTLFRLASSGDLDHFEDLYTSNFGSEVRSKIRNMVQTGPLVRGYYNADIAGRVAGSATLELSNRSLFLLSPLAWIPYLGNVFDLFSMSVFADAGLVTDAFCTCSLKEDIRSDAGIGLRLNGHNWLSRALDIDLTRSEFRFDFPIWLSHPAIGEDRFAFRFVGVVRQNF